MHVKKSEVEKMLDEVDADGSGEVEYPEFVQIMTTKLESQSHEVKTEVSATHKKQPLPFQLLAQAYRRKKLMEAVMGGDKAAQERLQARAEEAEAERVAVVAAMEAEKKDPTLRYDERNVRTISDDKYKKLKRAQAQKKKETEKRLPEYVVENLDEDVKQALLGLQEDYDQYLIKIDNGSVSQALIQQIAEQKDNMKGGTFDISRDHKPSDLQIGSRMSNQLCQHEHEGS
ncbi:hypothetical protein O6H91_01G172700 [Diphasiastrum complanatum]|uniref:Uncharacterized protein n=1 Tax=Diphasiastrum complanatum TaxID=34168 RepID=A0ACC2EZ17_DIPCM|nr:hypothetical protein O6H91_Y249100 [Diphasiastrum complanatum]KAJ7571688.1 hypothetical protein O6H91_01G172700 [Diphasiastrum complanatum]